MVLSRKELFAGLFLALILRLGYCLHAMPLDQKPLAMRDDYEIIAVNMISGQGYSMRPGEPTALREPGYVFFIALIYKIFGLRPWAITLTFVLLSLATVWLTYALAAHEFPGRGTRLAFWIAVFYPYFIYYNAYYYWFREPLLSFLTALLFLLLVRRKSLWEYLLAGTAAGLLCLSNIVWAPALTLAGLWLAFQWRKEIPAARWFAAFFLPIALMLGGWVLRNWSVFGVLIPGTSEANSHIYQAVSLPAEVLGEPAQIPLLAQDRVWLDAEKLAEVPRSQALARASKQIILEHPGRFLAGLMRRFWLPWKILPRQLSYTHDTRLVRLIALLSDGWLLPLAFLGVWWGRRNPLAVAMVLLSLTLTGTYALTRAPIRYRLPLMPMFIAFAGLAAGKLVRDERIPL